MKNLKRLLLFYTVLLSFSVIFQSCCEYKIKIIGDGDMSIIDTSLAENDTINSAFRIYLYPELEQASNMAKASLISSSYAFQCGYNYENMIDKKSIKLSCNKDFQYLNQSIKSGENFINQEGIKIVNNTHKTAYKLIISADSTFIQNTTFNKEIYTFQLEMKTDDGLSIRNSVSAYLDL